MLFMKTNCQVVVLFGAFLYYQNTSFVPVCLSEVGIGIHVCFEAPITGSSFSGSHPWQQCLWNGHYRQAIVAIPVLLIAMPTLRHLKDLRLINYTDLLLPIWDIYWHESGTQLLCAHYSKLMGGKTSTRYSICLLNVYNL